MDSRYSSFIHSSYFQQMKRSRSFSDETRRVIDSFLRQHKRSQRLFQEANNGEAVALAAMDCVEWGDVEELVAHIDDCESAGWSTRFAESIGVAAHGPLGFAALSAENLASALDLFQKYLSTRLNFFTIGIQSDEQNIAISLLPKSESSSACLVMQDLLCASVILLIDAMLDVDIEQLRISSEQNEGLQNLCERWGIAHEIAASLTIRFPLAWLELPSFYADATAFETNLLRCQQQKQLLEQLATPFSARIEKLLEEFFTRQAIDFEEKGVIHVAPTLDFLAQEFHMSPRTLMRRLKQEDSSYKDMLRDRRQELAQSYLLLSESVETVAHKLAYTDPGNFIRAFQEWTNLTPAAWREKNSIS